MDLRQSDITNMHEMTGKYADPMEIKAVKFAVENLGCEKCDEKIIMEKSICKLWEFYSNEPDRRYLEGAYVHIAVYLELGFPYEDNKVLFDKILEDLGLDRKTAFAVHSQPISKIPLKKCHVKAILGRWNSNLHSHKIAEAVSDIIKNVSGNREGTYLYHCGKKIGEGDIWEKTFWLYVTREGSVLYDKSRNKYYSFEL